MLEILSKYLFFTNFNEIYKNISNWPNPGGQRSNMSLNYPLRSHKCNFLGKIENNKSTQICFKQSVSTSLISALMAYLKTYQIHLIQAVK